MRPALEAPFTCGPPVENGLHSLGVERRLVVSVENQVLVEGRFDPIGTKPGELGVTEASGTSKTGMPGQPLQGFFQGRQIARSHRFTGVTGLPSGLPLKVLREPGRALPRQAHRSRGNEQRTTFRVCQGVCNWGQL